MTPANSILQLETITHLLKAIANDAHDLAKDQTPLADGGTVASRFTAAVLKLEMPYLQLLDGAQIPNPAAPTPAAAEAAEVAAALLAELDGKDAPDANVAPPTIIAAPAVNRPKPLRQPNPLTGRLD